MVISRDRPITAILDALAFILCFALSEFGDCEGAMLRPGNVHSCGALEGTSGTDLPAV